MPASPIAEAVILAHDVHAKDKEPDGRKTLDVIAFEVGIAQFHGADETEIARVWLRRLAKDPANLDVLLERFPEPLVESLLAES